MIAKKLAIEGRTSASPKVRTLVLRVHTAHLLTHVQTRCLAPPAIDMIDTSVMSAPPAPALTPAVYTSPFTRPRVSIFEMTLIDGGDRDDEL
jgi:hypothetical protein